MKFEDLKFMSIGGYCLSLFALGPNRIKGPVDNVLMLNARALKILLENNYYKYFTTTPRKKYSKNHYEFKDLKIYHNDIEDPDYLPELKKRTETLKNFLVDIKTNKNKYLIFSIPHAFYNNKKLTKELENCLEYLKKINILDKVIFIGATKANDAKLLRLRDWFWWDFTLTKEEYTKYHKKYNINYIELSNINLLTEKGQIAASKQFYKKVFQLIESKNKQEQRTQIIDYYLYF